MVQLLSALTTSNGKRPKGMKRWMHFASSCGTSAWPAREGDIWWSLCPTASYGDLRAPKRITPEALQDWVADTVGWAEVQFTAEAFLAADIHPTQVKPVIQAAFEAAAQLNTPKCRLRQVDVDQLVARCVAMALAAYPNLKALVLQELNVYEEAVLTLANGLAGSEALTKLTLDTCDMSSAGWEALMAALADSTVRHFKVRGGLCKWAQTAVHTCLKRSTNLQVLDLSSNPLSDSAVGRLSEALCANGRIKVLKLVNCGFGSDGAVALSKVVKSSQQLTSLHISRNQISGRGCCELAKAIGSSVSLQQLVAGHTGWDDAAMKYLATSLPSCPTLHNLDLEYCRITYVGSQALSQAALTAPLVQVKLNGNCALGSEGIKTWVPVLVVPGCPLTHLHLSDCEGGDEAAFALAGALRLTSNQGSLEVLEVASNHFTHKGVGELVKAAKGSYTLRTLDVSFNWLGPKAMAACIQAADEHDAGEPSTAATAAAGSGGAVAVGGSSAEPNQWHSPFQGGVPGRVLIEPLPHAPVEIKYESLLEFREIERIKSGQWQASQQQFQTAQSAAAPDNNQHGGAVSSPKSAASRQASAAACDAVVAAARSEASGSFHPLQSEFALPARMSHRSEHSSAASSCSSTVSTQTLASSEDSDGSDDDERDAPAPRDASSIDQQDSGSWDAQGDAQNASPFAEPQPAMHAGIERMECSRKAGPGVEQELQSMQDGTINIQLPVSFSAGDASLRLPSMPLHPTLKSVSSTPRSLLVPSAPHSTHQGAAASAGGSASAGGGNGGTSAGRASPHSSSLRAALHAATAELQDEAHAGSDGVNRSGPDTPTSATAAAAVRATASQLTSSNLSRLNEQLGYAAPAELLMQAAKRHGVVAAVAALPPGPSQPVATAPRQMSMSKVHTHSSGSKSQSTSADQSPREGGPVVAAAQDIENPFVSNPPPIKLACSSRLVGPPGPGSHKSGGDGGSDKGYQNPFLPPGNPFLNSTTKPSSTSFRLDAPHPSNPFLSLAGSQAGAGSGVREGLQDDIPFRDPVPSDAAAADINAADMPGDYNPFR